MSEVRRLVADFAARAELVVVWPEAFLAATSFRDDPTTDYGKVVRKTPACVVRPRNLDELMRVVAFLDEADLSFATRGAGHSSGGQALSDGGVVLDLKLMNRVVADDADLEEITVEGGAWWLDALTHLLPQGRRPLVVTNNPRTTFAGTLSVGGFGDLTHRLGLQIATCTRLVLVTPSGEPRALVAGDPLFQHVLAGRGQLGVIAEATVKTMRRSWRIAGRVHEWESLDHFLDDAARADCEMFMPRMYYRGDGYLIWAIAAQFLPSADPPERMRPLRSSAREEIDLLQSYLGHDIDSEGRYWPALEILLPYPDGVATWRAIDRALRQSGIVEFLAHGTTVMLLPTDARFPLAPFPRSERCLLVALRPKLPSPLEVQRFWPLLQGIAARTLESGGKIYLMSVPVEHPRFVELQFGDALAHLLEYKRALDPRGRCNPGLLPPTSG